MISVKKIAVLVHNDVMRDARVRKQARTLVAAGHQVDIFGFSLGRDGYPDVIEGGARLTIEATPTRNIVLKIGMTLNRLSKHVLSNRLILILSILGGIAVFGLAIFVGAVSAIPLMKYVIGAVGSLGLCSAVLWLKRKYIVGWIEVHWAYDAIAKPLARNVIGKGYDVVHCHDMIAMRAGEIIKKENPKITMIWDAHELYTELNYTTPYVSMFTGRMIARIAPNVDKMITISKSFVDIYAQLCPKLPTAEMVMNATRRPVTMQMDRALLRDAAGVDGGQKILLFQGALRPYRGVEMLLDAAPQLPSNWSVVFMGYGPLQTNIEVAAKAANSKRPNGEPCIAFIPPAPQETLRDWTSGADLGIIPYQNTSKNHLFCTPNKLWEYPNARVPILATDLIEMSQIITANGTGTLLPRDFTTKDIERAIEGISDEQLDEWRANCDIFNEVENWEKFEPNLLKAYA